MNSPRYLRPFLPLPLPFLPPPPDDSTYLNSSFTSFSGRPRKILLIFGSEYGLPDLNDTIES